jgi:hypothetical protein
MAEYKTKHLEFIQNIITRMNTNSFMIKGWSVTLISALFALAADKANLKFVLVAYIPAIMFWALDGFFLSQERQYRGLYKKVSAIEDEKQLDFSLDAREFNKDEKTWLRSTFSTTLNLFHGALLSVVVLVTIGLAIRLFLGLLCCHAESGD